MEVEPAARFANATTYALNWRLRGRRQNVEAIELARGSAPDGRRWRLRVWRERPQTPDLLTVDLIVASDDQEIDSMYENGMSGGGFSGPPMPAAEVMTRRMVGRNSREQDIVGELIPAVAQVKVLLDDTTDFDAQLVRTTCVENDYFRSCLALEKPSSWSH